MAPPNNHPAVLKSSQHIAGMFPAQGICRASTLRLSLEDSFPGSSRSCAHAGRCPDSGLAGDDPVLVVDDDKTSSLLAGKMLQVLGYRAGFASNGLEALDAFGNQKYHAILMDIKMPVMNGLDAAERIRMIESARKTRVPIIALTAHVMPGVRERCLAAGMNDFLSKPFKKDELAAKIACAVCRG